MTVHISYILSICAHHIALHTITVMLPPVCAQAYTSHNKKILEASRELVSLNFAAAAAELRVGARDDELVDMKVSCDGTRSKWGFTALYGVVVVASGDTSKVLDVELESKFCSVCSECRQMDETSQEFMDWWKVHQSEYGCNYIYIGSSSGMESKGALCIWEQSVEKYKLCYTSLIADGNSKTYNLITEKKPHTTS